MAALEPAFAGYGTPESVTTDQGSQVSADDVTEAVRQRGCEPGRPRRLARQRFVGRRLI